MFLPLCSGKLKVLFRMHSAIGSSERVCYDRNRQCRIGNVNTVRRRNNVLEENNKGNCGDKPQFPSLVAPTGIEPVLSR